MYKIIAQNTNIVFRDTGLQFSVIILGNQAR